MTPEEKIQKKQILSDPAAIFSSLHPTGREKDIDALVALWKLLQVQKKQHKEAELQARITSRKIGEAKHKGISIDSLKVDMQKQSFSVKDIAEKLCRTEKQILGFFDPGKPAEEKGTDAPRIDPIRVYPSSPNDYGAVSVSLLDNELDEWNAYVETNPAASIYHRAEWRDIMQQAYGHEAHYFLARDADSHIVGVLPLIRLKSRLFGDLLVSMPYFMTGGAVADHPSIEQQLMQAANDHAATLGIEHIEYRDDIPRTELPVRPGKVNMILPLPDSRDELWNSFGSKLRSQIKRPCRENPQILFGGKEYLDDFHAVYVRNLRDLGSPSHSKRYIQNVLDRFPEKSWIIVLRLDKKPVSAGLLLTDGDTLEIPLASTICDVNPLGMNMLLYWEVLKFALEKRFRFFNFGRSTMGTGTYRFKQQWGARPRQLYWHYWLNDNVELPSLTPDNPNYALAIRIWKRLPLIITRSLGPLIVKNLP